MCSHAPHPIFSVELSHPRCYQLLFNESILILYVVQVLCFIWCHYHETVCSQLCEWSRQRNVEGFRVDSWFGRIILNKLFKYLRDSHVSDRDCCRCCRDANDLGHTKCTVPELWSPSFPGCPFGLSSSILCFSTSPPFCSEHTRCSTLLMALRSDF